jgi:hypothetical protein
VKATSHPGANGSPVVPDLGEFFEIDFSGDGLEQQEAKKIEGRKSARKLLAPGPGSRSRETSELGVLGRTRRNSHEFRYAKQP